MEISTIEKIQMCDEEIKLSHRKSMKVNSLFLQRLLYNIATTTKYVKSQMTRC